MMAIAVGFRIVQVALAELFGDETPPRRSVSVLSGHAGPGFRDAFEYVTRAVTRGVYRVDTNYPKGQYDPHRPQSYAFVVTAESGPTVEVVLKEHFLPLAFYDYMKKGRDGMVTAADREAFDALKLELAEKALAAPTHELLEVRRLS